MPKEFIVDIELGSSKMTGIAGQKNLDGSITVLATVEEDSSSCIRKGVIYNIDKTCQCLTNIIKKLKNILKQDITQVYVGVGGRSIRSIKNVIVKDLPGNTIISQEMINELMDINRNMTYPDQEILDAATQEYKIDNQYQIDPVGIQCNHLEGIFLNILWRKNFYNNINTCFENANIPIAEMYLAPLAMADSVLTDSEKRAGCMLVDLGADIHDCGSRLCRSGRALPCRRAPICRCCRCNRNWSGCEPPCRQPLPEQYPGCSSRRCRYRLKGAICCLVTIRNRCLHRCKSRRICHRARYGFPSISD